MGTFLKSICLLTVLFLGAPEYVFGQSKQYQRPKPIPSAKSGVPAKGAGSPQKSQDLNATDSVPSSEKSVGERSTDKKVDITDLEKKY
ncbi:MAG: hypothetical protein SGI88_21665, partial [Candidatus Hydrogenedentes bacterium]|nr:hypothetical protein [Candidatus Hydrogenedentota bacterium]